MNRKMRGRGRRRRRRKGTEIDSPVKVVTVVSVGLVSVVSVVVGVVGDSDSMGVGGVIVVWRRSGVEVGWSDGVG